MHLEVVTKQDLVLELSKNETNRRLCGDITCFSEHCASKQYFCTGGICAWCGIKTYTKCMKCGVYVHFFPQQGQVGCKSNCFLNYHNDALFGLTRIDSELVKKKKANWSKPNENKRKQNRKHISKLKSEL